MSRSVGRNQGAYPSVVSSRLSPIPRRTMIFNSPCRDSPSSRAARVRRPPALANAASMNRCGLYVHPHGIEVRAGYSDEEHLPMSQAEDPGGRSGPADDWKQFAVPRGFTELKGGQ